MRKAFRLLSLYCRLNLAASMEYRAAFWVQAIGMTINNASWLFFWWIAFGRIGADIGGYTFQDVMFIWSVCPAAFGLSHIIFGNSDRLTSLIVSGGLDTFLTQPADPLLSMLCSHSELSAWGDLLYGIILFCISGQGTAALPVFMLAALTGTLLLTAVNVTLHALTFYIGDAKLISVMAQDFIINFSIYPIGIYPIAIRVIMFTIIPAAFITHVPLAAVKTASILLMGSVVLFTGAYCAFAWHLFHRGMRRYESGNLVQTRI